MNKTVYVCEGTCQAKISAEQYKEGLTTCGAEACSKKGHEFTKMLECGECGKVTKEVSSHTHN